ncbi:thioredoxin domain-containing protein [Jiella mangrovi]|uniref:Thioredoxin domain-containing protein n=1 Tax=Jiella mangrovi TaxID=2821407 RepID=A0ABS4BI55_9HYPH|nr:thioredoxin domain-containing protein [Jiella mangrovi]MBP0616440.1 thioredoxin domain-containing protein [Jiella mangrovi]
MSNLLGDAVSPYLLQHKDNPVHWREWSGEALAEAKRRDCPILLSVGYAACHWCHVMAHESFEDEGVAAVMNRLFVNVKVDREERPDIDHLYMTALHALGEQGGWPMTMFLTPEGKPFFGGTYFPKDPRYGRPGFVQVMEAIDKAWHERREEIDRSAGTITAHIQTAVGQTAVGNAAQAAPQGSFARLDLTGSAARIAQMIDPARGGMKGAPKFPNAPFMEILARSAFETGDEAHLGAFLRTTQALANGGIYDHLGGGLHRYSTDERWLVPHFEKMLYDNAQFLRHLGWAFRATGDDLFRQRMAETVGWLDREMRLAGGGLAASLDADSLDEHGHSEEGAFYVWQEAEIEALLGEDAQGFKRAYDVSPGGNWEGKAILHRLHPGTRSDDPDFAEAKATLLAARASRARPGRDDKVLADWNGLAIRALCEVSAILGDDRSLQMAKDAFAFVMREMVVDGRLRHAARDGRTAGLALSADYGALMAAAAALFARTLDAAFLEHGQWLAAELERWHGDGAGGHTLNATDSADVLFRLRGDQDEAVPSATSLVIEGLAMLGQASGRIAITEAAERAAEAAAVRIGVNVFGHPGIVAAARRLKRGSELAIFGEAAGEGGDPVGSRHDALRLAALSAVDLDRLDLDAASPEELPAELAIAGIRPERMPAALLCEARVCRAPVFSAEDLTALLEPKQL